MALYHKESKLADAVMSHPRLISVINRLGIRLGVGDSTIGSICREAGIDTDFFLSVINTFLNEDYFPVNARGTFSLEKTIDYLHTTSLFYQRVQMPNIERHFNSLMQRSGNDNNLGLLLHFFAEMKTQLADCIEYDEKVFYPSLRKGVVPPDLDRMVSGHSEVEEKLHDLLYFFVVHLTGGYDENLCVAVISAVFMLEKDYCQNNRIRNRILLPMVEKLGKSDAGHES